MSSMLFEWRGFRLKSKIIPFHYTHAHAPQALQQQNNRLFSFTRYLCLIHPLPRAPQLHKNLLVLFTCFTLTKQSIRATMPARSCAVLFNQFYRISFIYRKMLKNDSVLFSLFVPIMSQRNLFIAWICSITIIPADFSPVLAAGNRSHLVISDYQFSPLCFYPPPPTTIRETQFYKSGYSVKPSVQFLCF